MQPCVRPRSPSCAWLSAGVLRLLTEMHQSLAQLQARVSIPGILKRVEESKRLLFWVILGLRLSMNWVTDDKDTQRSLYEAYQVIMAVRIQPCRHLAAALRCAVTLSNACPTPVPTPSHPRPKSVASPRARPFEG